MLGKVFHAMLITMVIISSFISAYSLKIAHETKRDYSLLKLGAIVENSTPKDRSTFQQAISLRNKIHKQVPLKKTPNGFDFMDIPDSYLKSLRNEEVGHICGGLAATYITALESQGIPARFIGIFSKDKEPYDSHSTVEFWYNGKWYASDPTFNIMFKSRGNYLSYSELYLLLHSGGSYEIISNEFLVSADRNIENYYIKLEDLMMYMVVHPSNIWSKGERIVYPMNLFPNNWDGAISYKDGKRKDVRTFDGIYKYLSEGPLR